MGVLGCAQEYQVLIASKEGIQLGSLVPSQVTWTRVLDDFSECTIVVPVNPECCAVVADVHVWHHEIQLFRDGEYVWSGPIVNITGGRDQVTIVARDLMALLDKRIIHQQICFAIACGTAAADLSTIGAAIINDALVVDGHNYIIEATPTGITGERLYSPGENAMNVLQEAMRLGLDVTLLGRKFVLGASNGGAPFGRTATLTSLDFLGDLQFEEDGLGLATRAITLGDGFVGVATSPGSDVNGTDPYYGLLEYVSLDRSELNTQALANQGAAAIIAATYPAPTNLITPTNSQLSVNAPISISELVPGTITTIIAVDLCRPVQADMVLIEIEVIWDFEGEHVGVTYGSLGSQNSGEE